MRINFDKTYRIRSYEDAVYAYNRIMPFKRGRMAGSVMRPLDMSRRKDHILIGHFEDLVVCQLYGTNCVVYHKDGRVTCNLYRSQSTDEFMNQLLPKGLHAYNQTRYPDAFMSFVARDGIERMAVPVKSEVTFYPLNLSDGMWMVNDETDLSTVELFSLNMDRQRQTLRDAKFPEFSAFCRAYVAMRGLKHRAPHKYGWKRSENPLRGFPNDDKIYQHVINRYFAGPDAWPSLCEQYGTDTVAAAMLCLKIRGKCYDREEYTTLSVEHVMSKIVTSRQHEIGHYRQENWNVMAS